MVSRTSPIILLFLCGIVAAAPTPTPYPKAVISGITYEDIIKTQEHRTQLIREELMGQLQAEKDQELKLAGTLADTVKADLEHQKKVEEQTNKLNTTQDKLDKAAKALWWYRLHWWGAWIMLILGIIACLLFAWAKATGRLALFGATVASKIP